MVRMTFLVERLLQECFGVAVAERARVGAGATVAGDLVMLNPLRGADERRVEHVAALRFGDAAPPLFDKAPYARAGVTAGADVELTEEQLEPLSLNTGLLEVVFERSPQIGRSRPCGHPWQLLQHLLLGVVQILELSDVQIAQRHHRHNCSASKNTCDCRKRAERAG